ncbi:hcs1 [Symbiodinium natans]|uniref:Hcs1 protein n=1 Tax=Symbiodinium natans TaxID=878477 RepID=A0A812L675_9DINO|nr:hcs1 [Symbiodinium natans]
MAEVQSHTGDFELPTIPAGSCELADMGKKRNEPEPCQAHAGHANSNSAGHDCVEGVEGHGSKPPSKKRRALRAASSLAPNSRVHSEAFLDDAENVCTASCKPTQPVSVEAAFAVEDGTCGGPTVHTGRERKRPLRAASSLAPSASQSTWRDSPSPSLVPDGQDEEEVQLDHVALQQPGKCVAECQTMATEIASIAVEPSDVNMPNTSGALASTLVVESAFRTATSDPDIADGAARPSAWMEPPQHEHVQQDLAREPGHEGCERREPASIEHLPNGVMQGHANVDTSGFPKQARRRIIGKQQCVVNAPALWKHSSAVIRDTLGHTLRPPEAGFLVRVQGDGWGGPSTSGDTSYVATITEADADTYTVIRRGDCHGSWDETHVLKQECSILARTTSQQDMCLRSVRARRVAV